MPIWLADISNWQAGISVEQIAREGYSAIVCKATEGGDFRDKSFDGWIPRIKAAGAIPGAYHYLRAGDGAAQARFFHSRLAPHGGPSGMLIQLDCEADAGWDTVQAWAAEWRRLTNAHPFAIYTGAWWWKPRGWNGAALTPYLWHSHYVDGSDTGAKLYANVPQEWWRPGYGGWAEASVLQFSSKGRVAGKAIDVNAFRGTIEQLRALTRPAQAPAPSPAPAPKPRPRPPEQLGVDGQLGPRTIRRWQQVLGTPADGVISQPSDLVRAVQRRLNSAVGAHLAVDGYGIHQDGRPSRTIAALQRYLGTPADGVLTPRRSACVEALQRRLNSNRF